MTTKTNRPRLLSWARRHWKPLTLAGSALAAVGVWLFFFWFGFHTLFFDEKVDEAAPTFTVQADEPAAGPATIRSGGFIDRSHPTSGKAIVLEQGGERVLRLEGFETDNGPDLNVYLSTAPPDAPAGDFAEDFVDLGDLKGNIGDQNYAVPAGVDLDRYRTVVIWCVRFGVAFGTAALDS